MIHKITVLCLLGAASVFGATHESVKFSDMLHGHKINSGFVRTQNITANIENNKVVHAEVKEGNFDHNGHVYGAGIYTLDSSHKLTREPEQENAFNNSFSQDFSLRGEPDEFASGIFVSDEWTVECGVWIKKLLNKKQLSADEKIVYKSKEYGLQYKSGIIYEGFVFTNFNKYVGPGEFSEGNFSKVNSTVGASRLCNVQ